MGTGAMAILAAVLAFVAVAGVGFAFAGPSGNQAKTLKRAQQVTGASARERTSRSKAAANAPDARRKQIVKTLKDQERRARKVSMSLEAKLRQAGLTMTEKRFWVISAIVGAVALVAPVVVGAPPWIGLGTGFIFGFGMPRWIVGFLGKRRTKKFTEAFSDAIDIIVRGIKSGLPVHDCLKIIARESTEPLAGEFKRLVENIGMGVAVEQALEKMYERMPTNELRFFTIVLNIQAKTGGNLAEALGNLSNVLRARKLMREKIKALSSEAKASAWIIGCLPPSVITMITITQPAYIQVMFTDSRGHMMLLGAVIWMSLGVFIMTRMINFKF